MKPEEFRALVHRVIADAGDRPLLLAFVGARLHSLAPDLDYRALGYKTLREALAGCGDVGTLQRAPSGSDWVLTPGATRTGPPHPGAVPYLDPAWFHHVSEYDAAHRCWYDLAEQRLQPDAGAVAAEPERYVELPRADLAAQREWARSWCATLPSAAAAPVLAGLERAEGFEGFRAALRAGRLDAAWSATRVHHVVSLVLHWAEQHAIDIAPALDRTDRRAGVRPGTRSPHARPPQGPPDGADAGPEDIAALRAFLHAVIDELSADEVQEFLIPVRFLAGRRPAD